MVQLIEGDDLVAEVLRDGYVPIAKTAAGDLEGKIVIALFSGNVIAALQHNQEAGLAFSDKRPTSSHQSSD